MLRGLTVHSGSAGIVSAIVFSIKFTTLDSLIRWFSTDATHPATVASAAFVGQRAAELVGNILV